MIHTINNEYIYTVIKGYCRLERNNPNLSGGMEDD